MTAFISKGVYKAGVQAYQDHADPQQFYWVPASIEATSETIKDFKVDYWGISKRHLVSNGSKIWSSLGAILSGRANARITPLQENRIKREIEKVFGIRNPILQPLRVRSAVVKPVFADNTLHVSTDGDVIFPTAFQFGSDFNYLIATGNSLFAEVVASQPSGGVSITNPSFGVNIDAKCEFRGEPWKVSIEAELSSFWHEVRKSISVSGHYGWFKLGKAEYNSLMIDLERQKIIKIHFSSGSLDLAKFGEQIFEMGKQIAEAVNQNGGQFSDFFKLEPNPEPSAPLEAELFGGGWGISVNLSYSERSFTQTFPFKTTLDYEGNFEASVPVAMPLALACSGGNEKFFNDLDDVRPCVTRDKTTALQDRLTVAKTKQDALKQQIWNSLLNGSISPERYNLLKQEIEANVDEVSVAIKPKFLNGEFAGRLTDGVHHFTEAPINTEIEQRPLDNHYI